MEKEENKAFGEEIKKHKQAIAEIGSGKLSQAKLEKAAVEARHQCVRLALFYAGYKCECCSTENYLTLQHLIKNRERYFIADHKFLAARNYFFNTAILCKECHGKADYLPERMKNDLLVIKLDTIEASKKLFEIEEEKNCPTCGSKLKKIKT